MTQRKKDWITIGVASGCGLAMLLLVLYLTSSLPGQVGSYRVRVLAPQVSSLTKASNVMVAGLPAGRVVSVTRKGSTAEAELALNKDSAPLPRDSRFGVRLRTLVGENYIEIYPGKSPDTLPNGSVLPERQDIQYVEGDEILNTLKGGTRQDARKLIRGVGAGVAGRGPQLNRVVAGAAGVIHGAGPVLQVLNQDRPRVARLIDDLGEVTRAVGERGAALRSLARNTRTTFRSIADRDSAVRSFIDEMPPTLRRVRSTTATVQSITPQVAPVLSNLATAITEAKPAVRLLAPAATQGRAVVSELGRAAPPLQGTLRRLRLLAPPTVRALPQVRAILCQVNPIAKYLRPYAEDVATFLNNLGSVTNYYDATGHAARLYITVGPKDAAIATPENAKILNALLATGAAGGEGTMGYNPYPAPGHIGDLKTGLGVTGPADDKTPYERVQAEC